MYLIMLYSLYYNIFIIKLKYYNKMSATSNNTLVYMHLYISNMAYTLQILMKYT